MQITTKMMNDISCIKQYIKNEDRVKTYPRFFCPLNLFIVYTNSAYYVESDGVVDSNHLNADDSYGLSGIQFWKC